MFDTLSEKLSSVFTRLVGNKKLNERTMHEAIEKVRLALLDADVPTRVVEEFIVQVNADVVGKKVLHGLNPTEHFIKVVYDQLVSFLSVAKTDIFQRLPHKAVVVVCGLQGSGKTTSVAKLGAYLKKQNKRTIACASVDYCRPAAREQLALLSGQAGIAYLAAAASDPVQATHQIMVQFMASAHDVLLLDTAGRLHIDDSLMQQLGQVCVIAKPTYRLLVLDAMTGQESLAVAQAFDTAVGFDGALLTKMDSNTRAGAAFAFAWALRKPIVFVGTGEKSADLAPFYPDRAAKRMLGMGDLESLLERADAHMSRDEQERTAQALLRGDFTLEDFAKQMTMMDRLGSLSSVVRMLPGVGKIDPDQLAQGQREMKRFAVIISSMTGKERRKPQLIDQSRIKRIAQGAGVSPADVRILLDKFEQSKQFVKLLHKSGSFRKFF